MSRQHEATEEPAFEFWNDGEWVRYDACAAKVLSAAMRAGQRSVQLHLPTGDYVLTISAKQGIVQENGATGWRRPVRPADVG